MKTGTILVCVDGSPFDRVGLAYALTMARATGAPIRLLEVLELAERSHPRPVDAVGNEIARADTAHYLESVKARLGDAGVEVLCETREGRPAEQILNVADREDVDLIVLGSHGSNETKTFRLGSTAHQVVQHARQSLLLVRRDVHVAAEPQRELGIEQRIERVLVLLDGSSAAEASLPRALALAQAASSELLLCHIIADLHWPSDAPPSRRDSALIDRFTRRREELAEVYLHGVERRVRAQGARCRVITREAESVRHGVLSVASEEQVDLILLTSHGRTSSARVIHGGVAQQLLLYAQVPVCVVQDEQAHVGRFDSLIPREDRLPNHAQPH